MVDKRFTCTRMKVHFIAPTCKETKSREHQTKPQKQLSTDLFSFLNINKQYPDSFYSTDKWTLYK